MRTDLFAPKHNYGALRARCDRLSVAIMERARDALEKAGLGRNTGWNVAHNAMISYDAGQPWREVNYSELRRAIRLADMSLQPSDILSALYKRLGYGGFQWGQ